MIQAILIDDLYNDVSVNITPDTNEIYLTDLNDKVIIVLSLIQQEQFLCWYSTIKQYAPGRLTSEN